MHRTHRISLALIAVCVLLLAACSTPTPTEKVAASRAEYKATLNSFFVKETPLVEEAPAEEGEAEGEEGEAADADDGADEGDAEVAEGEEADVPVRLDVVLDVLVQHDSHDPLDGVTLDVTMVDASENVIDSWHYWADTAGMQKANQRPYSITFEDVAYEEGYGFHVEVRSPVAESERSQYREFDGL